ncbi:hypothetical protein BJ508DRAFT_342085 [Ascobolus immersus RN42]|uniref:Uncharacterized protein n=1 Tax=Ascobolus immersus RN42 TaxID=1160509 RepID=A0A3N4HT74_ASCIM|nr:hypothetical protein BJ508DRAFT_342085 [Ascobolus immersus RN42]
MSAAANRDLDQRITESKLIGEDQLKAEESTLGVAETASSADSTASKELVDVGFSLWDPASYRSCSPSSEEWKVLRRSVGALECSFPFLRVEALPEGPAQIWMAAGCILTTEEFETIHPLFNMLEGMFYGRKKNPLPTFQGDPWELLDKVTKYIHHILSKQNESSIGVSVEFLLSCIIINFPKSIAPESIERNRLPRAFGDYNIGYTVGRSWRSELPAGSRINYSKLTNPAVFHCGHPIQSSHGVVTSLGAAIKNINSNHVRILVAAHGFEKVDDVVYDQEGTNRVGVIRDFFAHSDVALMEPDEDFNFNTQVTSSEDGICFPAGKIPDRHSIKALDDVQCWSSLSGPCNFTIFSTVATIVDVDPDGLHLKLNRSLGLFTAADQIMPPSMAGCAIVRESSHELLGQFRFQSSVNPHICYAEVVDFLQDQGWECAA